MADQSRQWIPQPRCCWCGSSFIKITFHGASVYACQTEACQQRCIRHALIVNGVCVWLPLPRQVELLEAIASQLFAKILIGGAVGGTKSHALRYTAYSLCRNHKNFRVLLLRRTLEELKKHHMGLAPAEAPLLEGTFTKDRVDFAEGSFLQFGHCQFEATVKIWLSTSYDLILFDELATFSDWQFVNISSRTGREERPDGWPGMVVCGSNPGPAWMNDFFITKTRDPLEYPDYDPTQHHFIPAVLEDNPYMKPSYVKFLADLPKELREAYRWGSWDHFPGQFFPEFTRAAHVQTIAVPSTVLRFGGLRWGNKKTGIMLWLAFLPDGRLYVEAEQTFINANASDVALKIATLTRARGWTLSYTRADPGLWLEEGEQGEGIAETFGRSGIPLEIGSGDDLNGWQRVRHWLHVGPQGPQLIFSPACTYLIRTLPSLISDDKHPEIVDTSGETAAAIALRHALMSRPAPIPTTPQRSYTPDMVGSLFQDLAKHSMPH